MYHRCIAGIHSVPARRGPARWRIPAIAILAATTLTGVATACSDSSAGPVEVVVHPSGLDFSRFDSTMNARLTQAGLAGAVFVVVHRDSGIVHLQSYGSYHNDRLFLLASASKVLSAGVLMRLADQGTIDLDAPVGNYVGSHWGEAKASLTLAQMLSNSSGMVGLTDDPLYLPYLCQYRSSGTLSECGERIYQAEDSADIVPPDTEFRYGGGQWQLAGAVAVAASGRSWADLVRDTYNTPCGTSTLGYTNQFSGGTHGYPSSFNGDPGDVVHTDNPNIEGGGYIAAADYGKILLMHLRGGQCGSTQVLSQAAVARMQEDRIAEVYHGVTGKPVLEGYGLGWWIDRSHPGVVTDIGFYGATPWLDVGRGYGAMILIEGNGPLGSQLWAATKPILDSMFDAAHL